MNIETARIHSNLERMRNGDLAAREDLVRAVCGRFENLTRRMLKNYPQVKRWADTGDVQQNALIRLLRALEMVTPATTRDFFNLAAVHIRRELIDLARYFSARGMAASGFGKDAGSQPHLSSIEAAKESDLESWTLFHAAVERLAEPEREVVSLVYYHGWEQKEVAESFGVHVRTVRRWWQAALTKLHAEIGGPIESG